MEPAVRPFRPGDTAGVVAALRASSPYTVVSPEVIRWQLTGAPAAERFGLLVAEVDGVVTGTARTGLLHESAEPGLAFLNLGVHPAHGGRGVGSALLAAAEERLVGLGARIAYAKVADDPACLGFAERRGWRPGRRTVHLRLDLATAPLPDPPPCPAGVRLRTGADLDGDPRPLYEADLDASRDEPGEVGMDEISYADWLTAYWHRPDLDRELTSVAVVDGVVAAFSVALTDGRDRYQSGMTGTRRAYRGRGLARLVKHAALGRARAAGYRYAYTTNDDGNAAMLAVNRWLGHRPVGAERRHLRELFR